MAGYEKAAKAVNDRRRRRYQGDARAPGTQTADVGGRCPAPCGCRRFYSRDQARRFARGVRGREGRLRPFRHGAWWHLAPMTAGEAARRRAPDER